MTGTTPQPMSDPYSTIRYETTADRVATITLDRPDVLNAFDRQMCEEMKDVWARIKADPRVSHAWTCLWVNITVSTPSGWRTRFISLKQANILFS